MKSQIVLFLIYILISLPFVSHGEGVVHLFIQESEYELARLELYKQYYGADSGKSGELRTPIPESFGQHSDFLRTAFRKVSDTFGGMTGIIFKNPLAN